MLSRSPGRSILFWGWPLLAASLVACRTHRQDDVSILFNHVPQAGIGGSGVVDTLSGTVRTLQPGARLVIYVHSRDNWYVQPVTIRPFTSIRKDGGWSTLTHLGSEYAAVLVDAGYQPASRLSALPPVGGSILSFKTVPGNSSSLKPPHYIRFSAYDWSVREIGSDRYGTPHDYKMSNVSVDEHGYLHLRVTRQNDEWTCSEVALQASLGYGRYDALVEGVERLQPATVFDMFTWDQTGTEQNRREMNTQFAQWGDPKATNAEYSVQPFYRPLNTYRYSVPQGPLTLSMTWESGRIKFTTTEIGKAGRGGIAEHTFRSDIPSPESESVHLNLCTFDYGKAGQTSDAEVVVRRFSYLP